MYWLNQILFNKQSQWANFAFKIFKSMYITNKSYIKEQREWVPLKNKEKKSFGIKEVMDFACLLIYSK